MGQGYNAVCGVRGCHVCWEAFARMTVEDIERELAAPDTPSA
jgi:hypothetical protein